MASFAETYADQNERDYRALQEAVASGRVAAELIAGVIARAACRSATAFPARRTGTVSFSFDARRLLVEDADRALHRDGPEAADAGVVRIVEEPQEQQRRRDHDRHAAHHRACTTARSALSAKNSMKKKMIAAVRNRTIQSGIGITPSAP